MSRAKGQTAGSSSGRRVYRPDRDVFGRARVSRRWLGVGVGVGVLVWIVLFGDTGWFVMRSERQQTRELEARVEALRQRREALEAKTEALREPGGFELERVARESYFMQRPDEEVIHIVGGEDEDAVQGEPDEAP